MMQPHDRLVIAVDASTRDEILRLVDSLRGVAGVFKIGLQAFIANGPSIVREIVASGERVFLDLKIHDIPNTAKHAVAEAASLGASIATVHAAGGEAMLRACNHDSLLVLAVTVLTSLDEAELQRIGLPGSPMDNAVRLARLTKSSGLRGVVASPHEIAPIRAACGRDFTILTPGIRPAGSEVGDQRRTMTPREAIAAGADYIVVGRPITGAADARSAAQNIVEEMS
ncbi:MAG TPA: orotidine-5'-phosphate decarboxylase [Thermoanaerobaculia bacterium]|nr:orotidine-5'-phosphate decarboxylase [Thermoanaerobaculia bacterium]